jgi:hypothetical protein
MHSVYHHTVQTKSMSFKISIIINTTYFALDNVLPVSKCGIDAGVPNGRLRPDLVTGKNRLFTGSKCRKRDIIAFFVQFDLGENRVPEECDEVFGHHVSLYLAGIAARHILH